MARRLAHLVLPGGRIEPVHLAPQNIHPIKPLLRREPARTLAQYGPRREHALRYEFLHDAPPQTVRYNSAVFRAIAFQLKLSSTRRRASRAM